MVGEIQNYANVEHLRCYRHSEFADNVIRPDRQRVGGTEGSRMIWVAIGVTWAVMVVLALALCKVAAREDRHMEELYRQEGWGK